MNASNLPPQDAPPGPAASDVAQSAGAGVVIVGDADPETAGWAVRLRWILPVVSLALFVVALVAIHRALAHAHYREVLAYLESLPRTRVAAAILVTLLSYGILTRYDALALRWIGLELPPITVLLGAFVGYAFSNSVGMSWVSGSSVRYRFYAGSGFSAGDVARVAAFCSVTLWLGFALIGGCALVVHPLPATAALALPIRATRLLGFGLLAVVAGYVALVVARRRPVRVWRWQITLPSWRMALVQLAIGALDWACAAGVLLILLPRGLNVSPVQIVAVFLLAQMIGVGSQVPGGLGVFEGVILLFLAPSGVPVSHVAGALAAYRVIYYLLPLCLAALVLAGNEVFERRHVLESFVRGVAPWMPRLVAPVFAITTLVAGVMLLFSGATPATGERMHWLSDVLPLPVLETSHFLGSLVGAGLLLLARGLQRRLDAAYVLTATLLAGGIVASLLKGLDWEEAAILAVMLAALLPCRRHFYRKASLLSDTFSTAWFLAVALGIASSIWLGMFSYKHAVYSHDLWWRFAFEEDAPRFLRASVGAIALALVAAGARLLQPARSPRVGPPTEEDMARVRAVLVQSTASNANLALLGDKRFLFSESGDAFVMYGVEGRSWVAMGGPVGPPATHAELAWRFREICDQHGAWAVFYEVRGETLPLYVDVGLSLRKLGEQARVRLATFTLEGGSRKGLRQVLRRVENDGGQFEIVPKEQVGALLPEMRDISDAWLGEKNTREKGFSLGYFDEKYLAEFPCAVVRSGGRVVAFANVWTSGDGSELSLDLMRQRPDAPRDVMEYLFVRLMSWGKEKGHEWFDLGMAPLSGLEDRSLAPLWGQVGARVFRHGEHFYNFQGLRAYKEKFDPVWSPVYLASPGGLALPIVLTNVAALVSRGLRGVVKK